MTDFETKPLPAAPDASAPDGMYVRLLPRLAGGSLAHFELPAGAISRAVVHRSVEEIWYVLGGRGQMWRARGDRAEVVDLRAGVSVTVPLGTRFQLRAQGPEPLAAIAVTMPPWPGDDEAVAVDGIWASSLA